MITAADEISIDFSTSCTRDEAVAKLLGWMRGPIRRKYINVTIDGIPEEQLPYLNKLDEPVADQLLEQRQSAQRRLASAFENDEGEDILTELEGKVEHWDREIHRAAKYFRDIDDELAKGDQSELRIDQESTIKTGVTHVAISALEQWAKKRDAIVMDTSSFTITNSYPSAEIGSVLPTEDGTGRKGWLSPVKADGLYLTLAVLLDAFVEMAVPEYLHPIPQLKKVLHPDGRWVVQTLASFLEDRAAKANDRALCDGQLAEAIKDRIERAMKVKSNTFKSR